MPTVPRAQRQVGLKPLPNVGLSPNAPSSAFQPPAPIDTSGLTQLARGVYEKERQKANQAALLDADNQAWELEKGLFFGQNGALQTKGKAAIDAGDKAIQEYEKRVSEITNGLATDEQKAAFSARAQSRRIALDGRMAEHVSRETQRYVDDTFAASLANRYDQALAVFQDEGLVDHLVGEQKAIVSEYARNNGMAPELAKAKLDEIVSKTRVGVIMQHLTSGNDLTAKRYYEAHQAEITGSDRVEVAKALDAESTRGESQRQADRIMASTNNITDALSQAAQITDPSVRDATESRIRRTFDDRAAADRQKRDDGFDQATDIVRRTGDFDNVPYSIRRLLTPAQEHAVRSLEDDIRHPKKKTDMGLYATLMNMAGLNKNTQDDFAQMDLSQFYGQLDDADFERLISLQRTVRGAVDRAAYDDTGEVPVRTMTPDHQFAVPVPVRVRPDQRLSVPPAWLEAAKTSPRYRAYLEHMGVLVPAPSGDIDLTNP